ncbi:MAG: general secretion pathway protein GspB [Planctomycetota bacterium]|nr:general secretion pathway protein GspB [Planctomycetota bacterium]
MTAFSSKTGVALCLLAMFAVGHAFAGQAPADPSESMSLEELRAYQAFYFRSGGRDPLTMRLPTARELGRETSASAQRVAPTLAQMENSLKGVLWNVETALSERNYDDALKLSSEMIRVVDNDWPPLQADPPHLRRMDEQIRNYNRLAGRLKAKEEVNQEFVRLELRVEGVSWSPNGARAMINGRLVEPGEALLRERSAGDLRVEAVEPQAVIFQYKGFRFRKQVVLYAE